MARGQGHSQREASAPSHTVRQHSLGHAQSFQRACDIWQHRWLKRNSVNDAGGQREFNFDALARGVSRNAFRQFVIALTGYAKQEEIAGFFTNTSEEFMGSHSITDSHISTITDTILLLQYVEIRGEMARAINVFKMRGSWHDRGIREFLITGNGPQIQDSFSNFERIISGVPHRVTMDERSELSRIARGVAPE